MQNHEARFLFGSAGLQLQVHWGLCFAKLSVQVQPQVKPELNAGLNRSAPTCRRWRIISIQRALLGGDAKSQACRKGFIGLMHIHSDLANEAATR